MECIFIQSFKDITAVVLKKYDRRRILSSKMLMLDITVCEDASKLADFKPSVIVNLKTSISYAESLTSVIPELFL